MSFANLERVEVLGLPGSEGELRVRGDKTVTTTSDANLFVAWLEISLIGFIQMVDSTIHPAWPDPKTTSDTFV